MGIPQETIAMSRMTDSLCRKATGSVSTMPLRVSARPDGTISSSSWQIHRATATSLLPSEYRPYQYADRKPNRHSPRHCLAVGEEDGMGTRR